MRLPFEVREHEHDVNTWEKCCHIHSCGYCGYGYFCSLERCKARPGDRKTFHRDDCWQCAKAYSRCNIKNGKGGCGTYPSVFSKCPYCNVEEMKPFWGETWMGSIIRQCRCNRCGG